MEGYGREARLFIGDGVVHRLDWLGDLGFGIGAWGVGIPAGKGRRRTYIRLHKMGHFLTFNHTLTLLISYVFLCRARVVIVSVGVRVGDRVGDRVCGKLQLAQAQHRHRHTADDQTGTLGRLDRVVFPAVLRMSGR